MKKFANATINLYYLVDFCKRDTRTRRLTSVGLAQARPNYGPPGPGSRANDSWLVKYTQQCNVYTACSMVI